MKSLFAGVAFTTASMLALSAASAQTMPNAQPSICPSPSASNSLVDSTLQQNCVVPTPAPLKKPSPPPTPKPPEPQKSSLPGQSSAPESPSVASPQPQPTSEGVMR